MAKTAYTIRIESDYIHVERAPGSRVDFQSQPAMIRDILANCKAAGCRKILLTGPKIRVRLSTSDIYDLGREVAKSQIRIAVVEEHDADPEDTIFFETVARNRGGFIKFFADEDSAKRWLMGD